jgi:hypothetical protein
MVDWPSVVAGGEVMPNHKNTPTTRLDELVDLDQAQRYAVAAELRTVAETLAEVSDGNAASHVLGVLAHLLDPPSCTRKSGGRRRLKCLWACPENDGLLRQRRHVDQIRRVQPGP